MSDYQWTESDVLNAKRRAALKYKRFCQARKEAAEIEEQFWETRLVDAFPDLLYQTQKEYAALVSFKGGDEWCICKGPRTSEFLDRVEMLVWHRRVNGKFKKVATSYDCSEIVPFVKEVRLQKPYEEAAQ